MMMKVVIAILLLVCVSTPVYAEESNALIHVPTAGEVMQKLVNEAVSRIPVVGGVISLLVGLFWPKPTPHEPTPEEIWDMVKDQVEDLVDRKILEQEIMERRNELEGLKGSLQRYIDARNAERGAIMASLLTTCDIESSSLRLSPHRIHLLPLTATLAHIHVFLLSERAHHGKKLYPNGSNTQQWVKELQECVEMYRPFFRETYQEWKNWRAEQITISKDSHVDSHSRDSAYPLVVKATVTDKPRGISRSGEMHTCPSCRSAMDHYAKNLREMWLNDAIAEMATFLASTHELNKLIPGEEEAKPDVDPALATLYIGPLSDLTIGLEDAYSSHDGIGTGDYGSGGTMTSFTACYDSIINSVQLKYTDHDGPVVGISKGNCKSISVPSDEHVVGTQLAFDKRRQICGIRLVYTNSTSDLLGPCMGAPLVDHVKVSSAYQLVGVTAKHLGNTNFEAMIQLRFQHTSVVSGNQKGSDGSHLKLAVGVGGLAMFGVVAFAFTARNRRRIVRVRVLRDQLLVAEHL